MKLTLRWNLLAFTLVASVCGAADEAEKTNREAVQQRLRESQTTAETKQNSVKIDPNAVAVSDGTTDVKAPVVVPVAPAEKDAKPDPAAEAEAALQAEKTRVADEASAFAKGEGERYARRQKAYEAARSMAPRAPVEPAKKSSIAELQLADGRYLVVAGGERKVFASKAAAEPYLAEIRQAESDRPIVLGASARK